MLLSSLSLPIEEEDDEEGIKSHRYEDKRFTIFYTVIFYHQKNIFIHFLSTTLDNKQVVVIRLN